MREYQQGVQSKPGQRSPPTNLSKLEALASRRDRLERNVGGCCRERFPVIAKRPMPLCVDAQGACQCQHEQRPEKSPCGDAGSYEHVAGHEKCNSPKERMPRNPQGAP